jgi:hypothetical protein
VLTRFSIAAPCFVALVLWVIGAIFGAIGLGGDPLYFIPYSEVIYSVKDSILVSLLLAATMPLCYVIVDGLTNKQVKKVDGEEQNEAKAKEAAAAKKD